MKALWCVIDCTVVVRLPFLSEFSYFFLTPMRRQACKGGSEKYSFWGAPFHWPVKGLKDTVLGLAEIKPLQPLKSLYVMVPVPWLNAAPSWYLG